MEFKVGDKVRYVVKRQIDNVEVGEVGIIRGISSYGDYAVDFEESGYKHSCDGLCQSNHGWWCRGDTLEPVDSKTLRMADGTIIGEFSTGGFCDGFRSGKIPTPSKPVPIEIQNDLIISHTEMDRIMDKFLKVLEKSNVKSSIEQLGQKLKEEKKMSAKFTFNTTEGYRIDKTNNTKIPTITTTVNGVWSVGTATCDKADYDERQGCLEAIANMVWGNFDKMYRKAVKEKEKENKRSCTCTYCGQLLDTPEERKAHEDWHVECRKARHERYRLRKRAKEIAFEEAAQKMAKEIAKENK